MRSARSAVACTADVGPDRVPRRPRRDRPQLLLSRGRRADPASSTAGSCSPTPTCPASISCCPTSRTCGKTRTASRPSSSPTRTRTTPAAWPSCCATSRSRSTARRCRSRWPATASRKRGCSTGPSSSRSFDGERRRIGPIDCQFVPVTHSVPHGFAVAFFTPEGTIIHTGDFKLDLTPVDGRHTDLALLGELARRDGGIRLLLSDSTNAERPGFTPSEATVGDAMRGAVPRARATSASSSPASRRTCTGSSRSRRRRSRTAARSRSSAGRCCRTSRWRASAASSTFRPTRSSTSRRPPLRARRGVHHLHRFAGRADERAVADGRARAQVREGLRTTTSS